MNTSQFMDKQILDLMNHQDTNGDSAPTQKEEILASYDFQPIRTTVGSGSGSTWGSLDSRMTASSQSQPQPQPQPHLKSAGIPHGHGETQVVTQVTQKEGSSATVAEIERTVKKYVDDLLHALEGVSARLSQLETRAHRMESSVDDIKLVLGNFAGATDGRLRQLDNILREVQSGVQMLRDKQEIMETQLHLSKLQPQSKSSSETESAPPAPASAPGPDASLNPHQLVLQAPQAPPPQPQIQSQTPNAPQYPPQMPLSAPPSVPPYFPSQPQPADPTHQQPYHQPPQSQPQPQQGLGAYQQSAQTQAPPPPQYPPYSTNPTPQPQPEEPNLPYGPPPAQPYPPRGPPPPPYMQQPPHSGPMPPPSFYSPSPPPPLPPSGVGMYNEPPPPIRPGYGPPVDPYPYGGGSPSYRGGSGGMKPNSPFASGAVGGGGGKYENLPTAKVLPQAAPVGSGSGSGSQVPLDDVVEKVAMMGFSREQVRATVRRLTENGQNVDLNVVLDKLMNDGAGGDMIQPNKGWFNR